MVLRLCHCCLNSEIYNSLNCERVTKRRIVSVTVKSCRQCTLITFDLNSMILHHAEGEKVRILFFVGNCKNSNIKKFFTSANILWTWKLKFPLYNEPLKLAVRFVFAILSDLVSGTLGLDHKMLGFLIFKVQ